jgi:hypothetical protein
VDFHHCMNDNKPMAIQTWSGQFELVQYDQQKLVTWHSHGLWKKETWFVKWIHRGWRHIDGGQWIV